MDKSDFLELPSSRESEEALLGAVLINPSTLDQIDLSDEDFFIVRNQKIFNAMRTIGSSDLDYVSLIELIKRRGQLGEIGGEVQIVQLANRCPNAFKWEVHQDIIKDTATRRRVLEKANVLARAAYSMDESISDNISVIVSDLVHAVRPSGGAVHISKYLTELYNEVEERAKDPKEIYGLATGLYDFDQITHGLQPGEQFILAGAPGTGKSLLAFQLACGMAENGHIGAVYELEMRGVNVVRRKASAISKIKTYNLRSGMGADNYWDDFVKAIDKMGSLDIYLSEETSWTTLQLKADLSRLKQQYNIEWFIVDYLGKLSDRYGNGDLERLAYISNQLSSIAKDLNLAGLTIQSVTKEGYSNPSMKNVSGPTAIHHDADQIAILTKGDDENIIELQWEKMREGGEKDHLFLVKEPGLPSFQCKAMEKEVAINDYWNKKLTL